MCPLSSVSCALWCELPGAAFVFISWRSGTRGKRGCSGGYFLLNQYESVNCLKRKQRWQKPEDFCLQRSEFGAPTLLHSLFGGLLKNVFREGPLLFYEVTKENTFAEGFIKSGKKEEKPPLAAICPKNKGGKGSGNPSPPTRPYLPAAPAQTRRRPQWWIRPRLSQSGSTAIIEWVLLDRGDMGAEVMKVTPKKGDFCPTCHRGLGIWFLFSVLIWTRGDDCHSAEQHILIVSTSPPKPG